MEGDDDDGMLYGDMFDMIKDAYPQVVCGRESSENEPQEPNGDAKKFYRLLEEIKHPLYPDCEKYSSLSFIVKLLHIKCVSSWSNKSFSMLMELLKDAFPMCERLPSLKEILLLALWMCPLLAYISILFQTCTLDQGGRDNGVMDTI